MNLQEFMDLLLDETAAFEEHKKVRCTGGGTVCLDDGCSAVVLSR